MRERESLCCIKVGHMLHSLPSFNLSILMGTTPKKFSLFFLLLTLAASLLQVHARESQFFSKFSNNKPTNTEPQEQEPNFIPQTQDSIGYGLYGHLPPSTTTLAATNGDADDNLPTTLPENYNKVAYTTPIHSNTQNYYQKQDQFLDNGRYYDNMRDNMYNSRKQGMGETSFKDTAVDGGNMYNTENQGMSDTRVLDNEQYYHGNDMYKKQLGMGDTRVMDRWDRSTTHGGNMYNTEKQGMSDTRVMENGMYYYDLNSERFNANENMMNSRNGYETRGYYGNNDDSYNRYNSNAGFQENQEDVFTP